MGTNYSSQPASKSSWDSQNFGDVNMVLKWPIFISPPGHNELIQGSSDAMKVLVTVDFYKEDQAINQADLPAPMMRCGSQTLANR